MEKAEEKVNTLLALIKKSADRVIVGKAIWKLMAIPAILFGRAVIPTCNTLIEGLQRLENRVWRYLLGIGGYSTVESLRGEMGASMVKSRVMETMLSYAMDTLTGKFQEVKKMMLHTISSKKGRWFKAVDSYREELKISWEDLKNMNKSTLKNMIKKYDSDKWIEGMTEKISLRYYIQGKEQVGYENCYRNNTNSIFLARARTNTLKLEEHKGRGIPGYDKTCKLCKRSEENIVHFTMDCEELEEIRNYNLIDSRLENSEERMITLLFYNDNFQEIGYMLKRLWKKRRNLLEFYKKGNRKTDLDPLRHRNIAPQREKYRSDPGPGKGGCTYPRQKYRNLSVGRG